MIILLVLIAAATAWKFTSARPATYTATATVMVESGQPNLTALPIGFETGFEFAYSRDLGSQLEMMQSRTVLERAVTQLEPDKAANPQYLQQEASKLLAALKVRQVKNSGLLTVTVSSLDPSTAQRQANAVAEAYVYETRRAKLAAIENTLENTTKRLKELSQGKVDLSVNPTLTRVTAKIDVARAALRTASEQLQASKRTVARVQEQPAPVLRDAGTVLSQSQLNMLSRPVETAASEAKELSRLARQLSSRLAAEGFEAGDADIATMESLTRALASKLGSLSAETQVMRRMETDDAVQEELRAAEEQLQVATASVGAVLEQVRALYTAVEQLRTGGSTAAAGASKALTTRKEAGAALVQRILQHTSLGAATLVKASEQLQQIEFRRTTTVTQLQIQRLKEGVSSEASELSALAKQLDSQLTAEGFEVGEVDITNIENLIRTLAAKLGTLSSELVAARQAEDDAVVEQQLRAAEEQLRIANSAVGAILEPVRSLYAVVEQLRIVNSTAGTSPSQSVPVRREAGTSLVQRIVQHSTMAATALDTASGGIQKIRPRAATVGQWQLERISERVASATTELDTLSRQLKASDPKQGLLLTYAELAAIEIRAQTVVVNVAILLSETEKIQLAVLHPQTTKDLLTVIELVRVSNESIKGLPNEITGFVRGGVDSLSYSALEKLRQELQLALLTSGSGGSRVMDMAIAYSPSTNVFGRFRNVILAAVAALLLGVMSALVLNYFDRRVRDASQATGYLGLPLSASIASIKGGNPHTPSILGGSPSHYLEAFRMLRTNLGLDSSTGQVLLITSPQGNEGKTTVAANLARAVSLQGRKVLLIDGNLRKPDIARVFGMAEANGLSGFLNGRNEMPDYVKRADGVDILPGGAASGRSAEMLSSSRMKALLAKARQTYEVIIIDSLSLVGWADTRILAKEVDVVLLVLRPGTSDLKLLRESKQILDTMAVKVAGFVLNRVSPGDYGYPPRPLDKKLELRAEHVKV